MQMGWSAVALAVCASMSLGQAEEWPRRFGMEVETMAEPMETDRPDFTEGTRAVGRGRLQLEVGYRFVDGGDREHVFPESLLRVGVARDIELRLGWEGYSWAAGDGDGANDGSVGLKLHLWEQEGWLPDFGIIGEASMPVGSEGRSSDRVDPAVKLLWAYDVAERTSIAGNVNFAAISADSGTRYMEAAASVALAREWTEHLGTFVEYVGVFAWEPGRGDEHTLAVGVTVGLSLNLQLDGSVGIGLSDGAADVFAGVGFSVRW
jgi:hypothetical protein